VGAGDESLWHRAVAAGDADVDARTGAPGFAGKTVYARARDRGMDDPYSELR